ncbi:V-type immunoglobulin domain-containing suppressor of T-cell activation isoform X2 [Rhinatrema bivittatum]|uniref:V-type immunoglobulin domain-containing suppressor of T-cell activation isoform X2 n=1 Tax=Rhinatrema bivittatum TaxID=194408 RepID=UPI00112E648B|nr:V-type immunoglobulin domain-containing suppressor of T-cell activation isoform X2 [Rhinatrema bivittatum]
MDFYRHQPHHVCDRWRAWMVLGLALAVQQGQTKAFQVSAPYTLYTCPEGQNVTLSCRISGKVLDSHDKLHDVWHFSTHGHPACPEKRHIRNVSEAELHSRRDTHHGVEKTSDHHGLFQVILRNLSHADSGGYCCRMVEMKDHKLQQEAHSFMELRVIAADKVLQNCTLQASPKKDNESSTAAALAVVACVIGVLCLPLILILVYKQRKAITNRRAHELVRMDREDRGIENPVFAEAPGEGVDPKPQLNYIASRQQSESGHHLLSEPNTPLSPPGPGDCFFPSLEPVPDSPNLVNI